MKNFLYSLFIGLFGIAALTSIAFLLMYAAQSKQQAHLYSDLAAVRKQDTQQETASEPEKQASYQNLYWENTDMVGWILIEDTNIDYPVMQTPTDPTYYLKHDFEKNYTDYGCPFMQADCDALAPSDNLILYGHNMKDVLTALHTAKTMRHPTAILMRTVKGKGVSFMEDDSVWHGSAPDDEQMVKAIAEIKEGGVV